MRREFLFGDCRACSQIAREISLLFTDRIWSDRPRLLMPGVPHCYNYQFRLDPGMGSSV